MSRLLRAACLLLSLMCFAHSAFADEVSQRPTVQITIAGGSSAAVQRLTARLQLTWQKLDATVATSRVPAMTVRNVLAPNTAKSTARVWINLSHADSATIYVVEGGNVFERRVRFEQGFDNVALELLDVVTTSAVQAVLAGGHLGVTRAEFAQTLPAAAATPVEPAATAPAPRVAVLVGLTYQAALLAPETFAHGPGVEAALQWNELRLGLELRGRFAAVVDTDFDRLSLAPQGVRLGAARVFSLDARLDVVLSLAAGLDVTRARLSGADARLESTAPSSSVAPVISPLLRIEYSIERVRAGALLGVDFDLWPASYVLSAKGESLPIWSPWRVRPLAGLMVAYAF